MEPVKIIKHNHEILERATSNILRINDITSQNLSLTPNLIETITATTKLTKNIMNSEIFRTAQIASKSMEPIISTQINEISESLYSFTEQLKTLPDYSKTFQRLFDESQSVRATDKFLKNFKPSMSFDEFREFSEEVITISDYNIKTCPEPNQEAQYCYEEQILQSIEKT